MEEGNIDFVAIDIVDINDDVSIIHRQTDKITAKRRFRDVPVCVLDCRRKYVGSCVAQEKMGRDKGGTVFIAADTGSWDTYGPCVIVGVETETLVVITVCPDYHLDIIMREII